MYRNGIITHSLFGLSLCAALSGNIRDTIYPLNSLEDTANPSLVSGDFDTPLLTDEIISNYKITTKYSYQAPVPPYTLIQKIFHLRKIY